MAAKPKWKCNKSKFEATKGRKKKKNRRKQRQKQTKFKPEITQGIRNQKTERQDKRIGHRETRTQGRKRTGTRTRTGGT